MADSDIVAVRVRILGRVQGVGYRDWALRRARALRLRGWVRNRKDGSVEALLIGAPAEVDRMIADCDRGPAMAYVEAVSAEPAALVACEGFTRRSTA